MLQRFIAQAEEAENLGLSKISSNVTDQLEVYTDHVRDDDASYTYSSSQVTTDVEKALWSAVIRVADFYGVSVDLKAVQGSIEKLAGDLIDEVRINAGVTDGVGAYEPNVPGENSQKVTIEVEDK